MRNHTRDYGIVSANEAERAIWGRVLAGSAVVLAGFALALSVDNKQSSNMPATSITSPVNVSIEP